MGHSRKLQGGASFMPGFPETVKAALTAIVSEMAADSRPFVRNPSTDFTRDRLLNFENTVSLILSMGASSINMELLDYFQYVSALTPGASAFVQQRAKILPDTFRTVFHRFNSRFPEKDSFHGFHLFACDGTDLDFQGTPADTEYYFIPGNAGTGCCTVHVNALYSLCSRRYVDAVIQPCHGKDDFRAFCDMVDRLPQEEAAKSIFIADRGFASFNSYAHVIEKGAFFLIRAKEAEAKKLAGPLPGEFDTTVSIRLVRRRIPAVHSDPDTRFIWKGVSFDYLEYGADGSYNMSLRVVCVRLADGSYEYLITNLPADRFPPEALKELYYKRWGVETSFRELKYAVGLSAFHCKKPDFVTQEIWARLILYNFCELVTAHVVVEQKDTRHVYQLNYTMAVLICHKFLQILPSAYQPDVETLIGRYLLPVREERNYKRKVKPRHAVSFLYRLK